VNAVVRVFLENLLKKKGRTKTCKKIRKMLMNYIKEIIAVKGSVGVGKKKDVSVGVNGNDSVLIKVE